MLTKYSEMESVKTQVGDSKKEILRRNRQMPPSWSYSSYRATIMNVKNLFANRNQAILFSSLRVGNIDIYGR